MEASAWFLRRRPVGLPVLDDFELRPIVLPPLGDGMVRVDNLWMSVDPYMRGRMNDVKSYVLPFGLDAPLDGLAIGRVTQSRAPGLEEGDLVSHRLGWRNAAVLPAHDVRKLPAEGPAAEHYLHVMGATGATAYFGLLRVAAARPGETVFVSAAAGAVGSTVVQIARHLGMRVIASAGGAEKCALVEGLGAERCIDYRAPGSFAQKLAAATPDGIDVGFENVGGEQFDAVLGLAKDRARIAVCGMIDMYNSTDPVALRNLFRVIAARIRIEGFIVTDFRADWPRFEAQMAAWMHDGTVRSRLSVREGLDAAPDAFLSLFRGENLGKLVVRLGES